MIINLIIDRFCLIYIKSINKSYILIKVVILCIILLNSFIIKNTFQGLFLFLLDKSMLFWDFLKINLKLLNCNRFYSLHKCIYYHFQNF